MSANLPDLFQYGLEIIAMSVRMGSEALARSQSVDRSSGSWAYTFIGSTAAEVQAALKSFHQVQVRPPVQRALPLTLKVLGNTLVQTAICRCDIAHLDHLLWTPIHLCKVLARMPLACTDS